MVPISRDYHDNRSLDPYQTLIFRKLRCRQRRWCIKSCLEEYWNGWNTRWKSRKLALLSMGNANALLWPYVFRAVQSPVIYSVCAPWNSIFKCITYAQTINITPTWIHLWADLAEKPLTHVQGYDYYIPTKFGQHQSIGSVRQALCSHKYTCISDPPNPSVT